MVSKKIYQLIKNSGATQEQVANYIGMTRNGLSRCLINDEFKVSVLQKIAEFFNIPVSNFFENDTEMIKLKVKQGQGNILNLHGNINSESLEKENEYLRARIKELEEDKEFLKDLIKKK